MITFAPFDIVCLLIIILLIVRVSIIGFIAEFFSRAAVVIGVMGAVLFFRKLEPFIIRFTGVNVLTGPVSFLLIFILLYLVIKIIQQLAGSAFKGESMTNLDRAMGFFLGFAEGVLIVMVLIAVLLKQPWFDPSFLVRDSLFVRLLSPFLEDGTTLVTGLIPIIH